MATIVRAKCVSDSSADSKNHRVKVTCEGVFENLEVDSINGIYLRKDDLVYVQTLTDDWYDAMILGRCSGQLELQQLVDVINALIDIVNEDKRAFERHTHIIPIGGVATAGSATSQSNPKPVNVPATNDKFAGQKDKINCNTLLH